MAAHRAGGELTELRTSSPLHVSVVSDDLLFCQGLVWLLRAETTFLIADEATADVVLLDSNMSGALETCARMMREARPPVIFVGAPAEDSWASQALAAGARGILLKSARPPEMVNAIIAVHDGLIWAPRRVMVARIDELSGMKAARRPSEPPIGPRLSIREREVFEQAASGLGNKELADRLAISESTVKVHLTHIFQKLGVRGRAELAAAYHRVPLVELKEGNGHGNGHGNGNGHGSDGVVRLKH